MKRFMFFYKKCLIEQNMFLFIIVVKSIMQNYNSTSFDSNRLFELERYPLPNLEDEFIKSDGIEYSPLDAKVPKNAFRSIRYGKIKTDPQNLDTLIQQEMEDISPEVYDKIRNKLAESNVDRSRFKDLFFIKKRIIQDGNRRIVSFDIKEKIIPKNFGEDSVNADFSLRVILAGILFLLAGLVFTTTMKMYQNMFKKNIFAYDNKKDNEVQNF